MLPTEHDPLLTVVELGKQLNRSPATLQRMRTHGTGPAFITVGARGIRYRQSAVDAWLATRERTSTALPVQPPRAA